MWNKFVSRKVYASIKLRRKFIEKGAKVGQIGTEPSALLYGYDNVCPIGYGSNVRISDYRFISAVNKMFFEVSQKECCHYNYWHTFKFLYRTVMIH